MAFVDLEAEKKKFRKTFIRENYNSKFQDWQTPDDFIEVVLEALKIREFEFDVCTTQFNIPAEIYFTIDGCFNRSDEKISDDCGLSGDWPNGIGWMNPPYGSLLKKFINKIAEQAMRNPQIQLVALLPQRFENDYYQNCLFGVPDGLYFLKGKKLHFLKNGFEAQNKQGNAPQTLTLAFFNFDDEKLADISARLNQSRYTGSMIKPVVIQHNETFIA